MYIRREKRNISTVVPDRGLYKNSIHFLNQTGTKIFEMHNNGKRSVSEMAKELKRQYPKESLGSLINDVEGYLFSLNHLGIVKWTKKEGHDMEAENRSLIFRPMDERDIYRLSEILSQSFKHYRDGRYEGVYYTLNDTAEKLAPFAIRMRHFHFMESFFLMLQQGKIVGAISLLQLTPMKKSADFGTVIIPGDSKKRHGDALRFVEYMIGRLKELEMVKLKCNVPKQREKGIMRNICNNSFLELLKKAKFSLEATLTNELGRDKDLMIFSRPTY